MNRDEVISGLEKCAASECNEKCPYSSINCGCRPRLMLDAMELLKEQPEIVRCQDCKNWVGNGTDPSKLPYWLPCKGLMREPDYFCADGKRRDDDG